MDENEAREGYNAEILEQAVTFQVENGTEQDEELNAQLDIVRAAQASGDTAATDHSIDHLRRMLEISYTEESELPAALPARGEAPAIPAGRSDEVFEFTVRMTRGEICAVYSSLEAIYEYSINRGEGRAAEILLGAIPNEALHAPVELFDVHIADENDEPVTDFELALTAMRAALGQPSYFAHQVRPGTGAGSWRVELPLADQAELRANRFWGREADGFEVSIGLDD